MEFLNITLMVNKMIIYDLAFKCGKSYAVGLALGANKLKKHHLTLDAFKIKHPKFAKAENGKTFAYDPNTHKTSGLGANLDKSTSLKALYGHEFTGINLVGQKAINLLRQKERGHIKSAFHKKGIGDIDLIWGDDKSGLLHIIKSRKDNNQPVNELLNTLNETIEKGVLIEKGDPREKLNYYIEYTKCNTRYRVVVTKFDDKDEDKNNKVHYVLTAMEVYKKDVGVKKHKQMQKI